MTQQKKMDRPRMDEGDDLEDQVTQIVIGPLHKRSAFGDRAADPRASMHERLTRSGALAVAREEDDDGRVRVSPRPVEQNELTSESDPLVALGDADLQLVVEDELLTAPSIPQRGRSLPPLPARLSAMRPIPQPPPSILLGPGASTRHDATERIPTLRSVPPIADALAPQGAESWDEPRKSPTAWQLGGLALLLVGMGVGGGFWLARSQSAEPDQVALRVSAPVSELAPVPVRPSTRQGETPRPVVEALVTPPATVGSYESAVIPRGAENDLAHESAGQKPAAPAGSDRSTAPASARAKMVQPPSDLPPEPTREQVIATMSALRPELARCVGNNHGVARITLTVRPSGAVSYALVSGNYAGTDEGSCIANAVRGARFPAFSNPSLKLTYPFQL